MCEGSITKRRRGGGRPGPVVFILFALIILSAGCEQGIVSTSRQTIPDASWAAGDTLSFPFHMDDTSSLHDLLIYVRNTTDYPYRNIYFFIDTRFPDGQLMHDTLEFMLSDPAGNWLGNGKGFYRENRILYRYNTRFAQPGDYRMSFVHAMRTDTLEGIDELGLIIRKAKYYMNSNGEK